jgi:hypothetical protein
VTRQLLGFLRGNALALKEFEEEEIA